METVCGYIHAFPAGGLCSAFNWVSTTGQRHKSGRVTREVRASRKQTVRPQVTDCKLSRVLSPRASLKGVEGCSRRPGNFLGDERYIVFSLELKNTTDVRVIHVLTKTICFCKCESWFEICNYTVCIFITRSNDSTDKK